MVQKKWTSVPLIGALLLFSGCYRFLASPASLTAVEREIEAVEAEVGDANAKARHRRLTLRKQLEEIKRLNHERVLFFTALRQRTQSLSEDMVQLFDDMGHLSGQMKQVTTQATRRTTRIREAKKEAEGDWKVRRGKVRAAICVVKPNSSICKGH